MLALENPWSNLTIRLLLEQCYLTGFIAHNPDGRQLQLDHSLADNTMRAYVFEGEQPEHLVADEIVAHHYTSTLLQALQPDYQRTP
jgi:hypothetical protein